MTDQPSGGAPPRLLTDADRRILLLVARGALTSALGGGPPPKFTIDSPALKRPCGAFVTLTRHGHLRGCIGTFSASRPLHHTIREMAAHALRDPRFTHERITLAELPHIHVEISVLSPLEKVQNPLKDIELGRHGISVEGPWGSGCFLPQVATETGWSVEEFLAHCCAGKAGLSPDAWKDPSITVYRFEAEVFGEDEDTES